jgi:hypothetical protein
LIYVASRTARAAMWKDLRAQGNMIISTWIDQTEPGQTANLREFWSRVQREVCFSEFLLLYAEPGDFPLKGALVEVGIAIGAGVPVVICLPGVVLEEGTFRPLGSWVNHPRVTRQDDVALALRGDWL